MKTRSLGPNRAGRLARLAASALAAALLSGCDTPEVPAEKDLLRVTVVAANASAYASVASLTGEIEARLQSDLSFRIGGRIASLLVDVGEHVQAGDILATLETTRLDANLKVAEAQLQSAEATLAQSQREFARLESLLKRGFTTRALYDDADAALHAAQADRANAQAALSSAQDDLDNATLYATKSGVITARHAEVGQVMAAASALFTFAEDGDRDAVFAVPEAFLARKPVGEVITISLLSDPSVTARGAAREISQVIDRSTGSIQVKVGVMNTPPEMTLGAAVYGLGRFDPRDLFILPWTAYFTDSDGAAVWIVDPKTNTVSIRPITVDSYQTGRVLVASGLAPGDLVVVDGAQLLRPGQLVAPTVLTGGGAEDGR